MNLKFVLCILCVCIGWDWLCSLRGTIIAGNPLHGRLICFHRGHYIPVLPPSILFFFSIHHSSAGFLPLSLLHSAKVISWFFPPSHHISLHPSFPSLSSCPSPLKNTNLITQRIKAFMFTPCPFENQTHNERLGIFYFPRHLQYFVLWRICFLFKKGDERIEINLMSVRCK